jgi:hypothetical protein
MRMTSVFSDYGLLNLREGRMLLAIEYPIFLTSKDLNKACDTSFLELF